MEKKIPVNVKFYDPRKMFFENADTLKMCSNRGLKKKKKPMLKASTAELYFKRKLKTVSG